MNPEVQKSNDASPQSEAPAFSAVSRREYLREVIRPADMQHMLRYLEEETADCDCLAANFAKQRAAGPLVPWVEQAAQHQPRNAALSA